MRVSKKPVAAKCGSSLTSCWSRACSVSRRRRAQRSAEALHPPDRVLAEAALGHDVHLAFGPIFGPEGSLFERASAFRAADGRALADAGARVVLATNCNPGSAPCLSVPMAIALGVRHCGLTPEEAIVATTLHAAAALGFDDRGFIAPGARADLVLLRHTDERLLAYEFGGNPVDAVIVGGRVA